MNSDPSCLSATAIHETDSDLNHVQPKSPIPTLADVRWAGAMARPTWGFTSDDPHESPGFQATEKVRKYMRGATTVSPMTSPSMPPVAAGSSLLTGERLPLRLASLSPLRYPGSKRKMLPAIRQLIDGNIPHPELFVEPFCGGASVSLGLLELNAIQRVLLADVDPLVAAFWQAATRDADGLIKEIRSLDVTVEQWDYWRRARPRSIRQLAVKCLFLNRTTFSGILGGHAGPIGGRAQSSDYTIDCRFNKDALAERILNVKPTARRGPDRRGAVIGVAAIDPPRQRVCSAE